MSKLDGVFSLRTPRDLLLKLRSDHQRLKTASDSDPIGKEAQYAAFDFFVTAESLADWQGKATDTLPTQWQKSYPYGALVSHVANGGKHFRVDRHKTVRDTKAHEGSFSAGEGGFSDEVGGFDVRGRLSIELENGTTDDVLDVVARVLDHWKAMIK